MKIIISAKLYTYMLIYLFQINQVVNGEEALRPVPWTVFLQMTNEQTFPGSPLVYGKTISLSSISGIQYMQWTFILDLSISSNLLNNQDVIYVVSQSRSEMDETTGH